MTILEDFIVEFTDFDHEKPCQSIFGCDNVAIWRSVLSVYCGHVATDFCLPCTDSIRQAEQEEPNLDSTCAICFQSVNIIRWKRINK